ncbi:MAG: acyl-CoA dehydrogenase family protein, partial [Rhodospirillales bacterium]|nr:acyl-CoA dehydrogenase family protein [Rhodospirillales bacterium]
MDFAFDDTQTQIRDSIQKICANYSDEYWLQKDREGGFPGDFANDIADAGWLGIAVPEEHGGAGLGVSEAAVMMMAIAESGAGFAGASSVHMNIFGLNPVVVHGTGKQKQEWLPPIIAGQHRACFGVTEPDAGLDTANIKTRAELQGEVYLVNGAKIWTSTAQTANKILLLARTAPIESTPNPIDGLTLFYTDLDRDHIQVEEIEKMGRKAVDSNMLFIDDLPVPVHHRIGEEGLGFRYLLEGFNPERILIAAEAVGLGRAALKR